MFALAKSDGLEQQSDKAPDFDRFWSSSEQPSTSSGTATATAKPVTTDEQTTDDKNGVPDTATAEPSDDDDSDWSLEYGDSKDAFTDVLSSYIHKRNFVGVDVKNTKQMDKSIVEYLNMKYLENNFRSIGLISRKFDKNNIMEAKLEFESFEKWLIRQKNVINGNTCLKELGLPMFCHLYLSLYSQNNQEHLLTFLDTFKHLFENPNETDFLLELKNVTNTNNLSSRLTIFRKNKYVCSVSPKFLTRLCSFMNRHQMLKVVFQEWFDVTYSTNENPLVLLNKHFTNINQKINDPVKKKNDESENNDVRNDNLNNEILNDEKQKHTFKENSKMNNNHKFTSNKRSNSSENSSEDSTSENSYSDEETVMRKYIKNQKKSAKHKTLFHLKPIFVSKIDVKNLDEDSDLCTMRQIILTNCSKLSCSILTSDHKYVAAGSLNSLIYVWERSNLPTELEKSETPDLNLSGQSNNFNESLDRSTAKILRGHGGSIFDLAEISSINILLSASHDRTFRVWNLVSKLCLEVFNEHEHRTWCISACPNSLKVVTGSCDGVSCLWFLNYKHPMRFYVGHLDDVLVLKLHPNQMILATGSADKTIRIFELMTGECQRLLVGHSDYISCLEFHADKPNIIASACGAGEIMVWNISSGETLWKLKVGNVSFSDIVWLTNEILLASLTTGVVLKCDVTENYYNTNKLVKGFTTKFNRLMCLRKFDSILYTIGLPGKSTVPKSSSNSQAEFTTKQNESSLQQDSKSKDSSSKFVFPQHIIQNNRNFIKSKFGLKSETVKNPLCDLQYQLVIDPDNIPFLTPEFLQMDSKTPFVDLTSDDDNQLKTECVSNKTPNKKPPPKPKANRRKTSPAVKKKNKTLDSKSLLNNLNPININKSKLTTSIQQFDCNKLLTNPNCSNVEDSVVKTSSMEVDEQNPIQPSESVNTNLETKISAKQQTSKTRTMKLPRLSTQKIQKDLLQKDQQLQMQNRAGSNIYITSANASQQPLFQQIQPNTKVTKINSPQRKPKQQRNIQLTNVNVSQSQTSDMNTQHVSKSGGPSMAGVPIRVAIRQQKSQLSKTQPSLEKMPAEDYAKLQQAVMASLIQKNPEMFSRGQTVIGEITRSQSTAQSFDVSKSNPETELQESKNTHK